MTILKQPKQFTPPLRMRNIVFCCCCCREENLGAQCTLQRIQMKMSHSKYDNCCTKRRYGSADRSSHTHVVEDQQTFSCIHFNLWFIRNVVARNANENKRESHFNSRSIGSEFCVMRNAKLNEPKNYVATSLFNRFPFFLLLISFLLYMHI